MRLRWSSSLPDGMGSGFLAVAQSFALRRLYTIRKDTQSNASLIRAASFTSIKERPNLVYSDLYLRMIAAKQAAEKHQLWSKEPEKHTSGAKAPIDSIGFIPGINPRPTARMSFSAAC